MSITRGELKKALSKQARIDEKHLVISERVDGYIHGLIPGVILVLVAFILSGGLNTAGTPRDPVMQYVLDGLIGGLLYVFVQKIGWDSSGVPEIIRRVGIGMIGGYVVYAAGLPDSITALSMGYAGIDMIEALLNRIAARGTKYNEGYDRD